MKDLRLHVLTLALACGAGEELARACSCRTPAVKVTPSATDVAPLNAHVWLEIPLEGWLDTHSVKAEDLTISVRTGKTPVAVSQSLYGSGGIRIAELVPGAPLKAKTRYQVFVGVPGAKEGLVGEFQTGSDTLTTPPEAPALGKSDLVEHPSGVCASAEPAATVEVHVDSPVRYLVWMSDDGSKIDYATPASALVEAQAGGLVLGHVSTCTPTNLGAPPKPRGLFGLKAVDLAGNLSAATELRLPGPPPPPPPPAKKPPAKAIKPH